ncbi:V-type ATP synthase subunit D, partial [candidate division NPL-UPA2 bacterium]|nr:V-type ATP synthase subunit D [candidate division NPL-UPA2 bacterium]
KRLFLARRGHKLLKDKQEELMKRFLSLTEESKRLREGVEEKLRAANGNFLSARGVMPGEVLEEALLFPGKKVTVETLVVPVMNLRLPRFELREEGELFCYGLAGTSGDLDVALSLFWEALPSMLKLAEVEKWIEVIAEEIERTRRRVNALEYILIPGLEETIRFIGMKLSERERGNLTRLMKVKEMVSGR